MMMSQRENILRSVRFERPERIPMGFRINPACRNHYPPSVLDELQESHPYLFPGFHRSSEPPALQGQGLHRPRHRPAECDAFRDAGRGGRADPHRSRDARQSRGRIDDDLWHVSGHSARQREGAHGCDGEILDSLFVKPTCRTPIKRIQATLDSAPDGGPFC